MDSQRVWIVKRGDAYLTPNVGSGLYVWNGRQGLAERWTDRDSAVRTAVAADLTLPAPQRGSVRVVLLKGQSRDPG